MTATHRAATRSSSKSAPAASRRSGRTPLGAILALSLLSANGCTSDEPTQKERATAERQRIERIVVATGTIEPAKEVEVRPRIAGIIERIPVEAGDIVAAGQVLVEIERELLEARVREAEAVLRAAHVERRYAGKQVNRLKGLHDKGASSDQARDDASASFEGAGARVARARAALDTLSTQLSYATVKSPLAGRVLDVHTEEGNAVSPVSAVTGGTLLLSLAGTDALHLEGLVDENEVARLEVGQPARIRTEAFGDDVFEGVVQKIAPLGERVQNVTYFEVEVEVTDARSKQLRPRMSGDAEIVTEVVEDAIVVPETALRYGSDGLYVELAAAEDAAGDPETRPVEIGIVDGDRVQVLSGLEAGEEVYLQ